MAGEDKTEKLPSDPPRTVPTPRPPSVQHGRFDTGALVANRYRIISKLGAGGMGEVYRADDTKLGQPVALKFLPHELSSDQALLDRLHTEVRIGRTVSHPNVCRLYDIAEAEDGHHFIAMEYVAGEDLASLLKRIGRFPHDKGLEIARQLCSGLAAAHAKGILHRDLKPANVMLDADGDVRITDFGLAIDAAADGQAGLLVGTPAYMAPEQLQGAPATAQSDIYSLGLVLYEIFTGRRAIRGRTLREIRDEHSTSTIENPSSIISGLDPAIASVISRCTEKDPAKRPSSVRALMSALPGGDPLAAAVAAGETPSPELVVAAGIEGSLRPAAALTLLVAVAALLTYIVISGRQVRFEARHTVISPDVARATAERLVKTHQLEPPNVLRSYGFKSNARAGEFVIAESRAGREKQTAAWVSDVVHYWYVTRPAETREGIDEPTLLLIDPLPLYPATTLLRLDSVGRLREFRHLAPEDAAPRRGSLDWRPFLTAAGVDPTSAIQTPPRGTLPVAADERFAWRVPGQQPLHFEAAAHQGRPVWFRLSVPWDTRQLAERSVMFGERSFVIALSTTLILALLVSVIIAWQNVKRGRADVRGTIRLAAAVFILAGSAFLLRGEHSRYGPAEFALIFSALEKAAVSAALLAVLYLGLEPVIRRRWPERLVSWSRLLDGQFRDPLVGRDILIGLIGGFIHTALIHLSAVQANAILTEELYPNSLREDLGSLASNLVVAVFQGLGMLLLLVMTLIFVKKRSLAVVALYGIIATLLYLGYGGRLIPALVFGALLVAGVVIGGAVTTAVMQFSFFMTFQHAIAPSDDWLGSSAIFALALLCALTLYAFTSATGSRRMLNLKLLDD